MNQLTGVICNVSAGKVCRVPMTPIDRFDLNLSLTSEELKWKIGIDQSSSCTGLALLDEGHNYLILLDFKSDQYSTKQQFYNCLFYFIKRLITKHTVHFVVCEKPVPSKYRYAGDVLRELKGQLKNWLQNIPELDQAIMGELYPQTWKSLVMNPKKGKNRSNNKREIASDLVDIFPVLQNYFSTYPFKDFDSFDALGLLLGYESYAFDENGCQKICGSVEKRHTSFVCYQWVNKEQIGSNILNRIFGISLNMFKPSFRTYNQKYNLHTNIRMASSTLDATFTIVPENELAQFQWEYGIDIEDDSKVLLMFVFRKGAFTASNIEVLQLLFSWYKNVYNS